MNDEEVAQVAGAVVYGSARAFVDAGLKPSTALRVAAAVIVREALGDEALKSLGVPAATLSRWRQEARNLDIPDVPPADAVRLVEGARPSGAGSPVSTEVDR